MDGITHITVDNHSTLLTTIESLPSSTTPSLFLDLEGISLSRHGSISIIILFIKPTNTICLIDVHNLQSTTFTTPSPSGQTLKTVLESPTIKKVFFDLRNDSDALFSHFSIALAVLEDVQLMENASRPAGRRRFLNGLERCIDQNAPISFAEKRSWKEAKEKGLKLFHPSKGGSYHVFNERPLREDLVRYCANDVRYLSVLRDLFWGRLGAVWKQKVTEETEKRIRESQSPTYEPQGESKKFGSWEKGGNSSVGSFWLRIYYKEFGERPVLRLRGVWNRRRKHIIWKNLMSTTMYSSVIPPIRPHRDQHRATRYKACASV
jgi:exonuclease 3'-5' domain-containing protein 1